MEELTQLRQSVHELEEKSNMEKVEADKVIASLRDENANLKEQNQALSHKIEWAMGDGLKGFVKKLRKSVEFNSPYGRVTSCATSFGYAYGVRNGYRYHKNNIATSLMPSFDPRADQKLDEALASLSNLSFPYLDALGANCHLSIEEIEAIEPAVPEEDDL